MQKKAEEFVKRLVGNKSSDEHASVHPPKTGGTFKPHPDESANSDPFKPRAAPATGTVSKPKT
jgi:hypothetical protein